MYLAINGLVFLLLSLYALRVLFSKASYVKFSKDEYVLLTAPEKFLLFTMVTSMISCSGGGLSSLRLMVWIVLIIAAFLIYKKNLKINIMFFVGFIFLFFILVSFLWSETYSYGFRVFLKYLYPFLIMVFAMTYVTSKEFIFVAMKYLIITGFILSIFLGGIATSTIGFIFYQGGIFWPMATLNDFFAIIASLSFVLWWKTGEKKYLFLIVWFLLSALLQSVRTSLLCLGFMFMFGIYLRYRLISLPYIIGIFLLGISAILFVPNIKEKMFYDVSKVQTFSDITKSLNEGNVNSSQRFKIWEILLDKFYKDNELLGSGSGSVQNYMYTNPHYFGGLDVPHNDFVQMLGDFGKVGVFLYLLIPLTFLVTKWKYFKDVKYSDLNMIATIAILSYVAILPAMNFDNVVNYSLPVHSMPFVFIGLFYAYKRILIQEERDQNV